MRAAIQQQQYINKPQTGLAEARVAYKRHDALDDATLVSHVLHKTRDRLALGSDQRRPEHDGNVVHVHLVLVAVQLHAVQVLGQVVERVEVVRGEVVQDALETEHALHAVLGPVRRDHLLVQLCKHEHARSQVSAEVADG